MPTKFASVKISNKTKVSRYQSTKSQGAFFWEKIILEIKIYK